MTETNLSAFIWSVADLLRGDYKQSEYGKVILPFTVLRRLDCVLAGTKAAVLAEQQVLNDKGINPDAVLRRVAGASFYNASPLDLQKLIGDPDQVNENLYRYIQGFSLEVRDIFDRFEKEKEKTYPCATFPLTNTRYDDSRGRDDRYSDRRY